MTHAEPRDFSPRDSTTTAALGARALSHTDADSVMVPRAVVDELVAVAELGVQRRWITDRTTASPLLRDTLQALRFANASPTLVRTAVWRDTAEVASALGVTRRTVQMQVARGRLQGRRRGRRLEVLL